MTTSSSNFQRWEKDPFFFAAEQVQDSADRLESAYRAWIHAKSTTLSSNIWDVDVDQDNIEFCRRALSTALGIATGHLKEFEKVSREALWQPHQQHVEDDDAPQRHRQFIDAISNQLFSIKNALLRSEDERDLKVLPAVSTRGQEESDDFLDFLCGATRSIRRCDNDDMPMGSCSTGILRTCDDDDDAKDMLSGCAAPDNEGYTRMFVFGTSDECSSRPRETVGTNKLPLCYETCNTSGNPSVNIPQSSHGEMIMNTVDFICINIDESATSGLLQLGDCYDNVGTCIESRRPNGHHRCIRLGGQKAVSESTRWFIQATFALLGALGLLGLYFLLPSEYIFSL